MTQHDPEARGAAVNLDEARRVLHTRIANAIVSVEDAYGTLITYPISDALATAEIDGIVDSLLEGAWVGAPDDESSTRFEPFLCIPLEAMKISIDVVIPLIEASE